MSKEDQIYKIKDWNAIRNGCASNNRKSQEILYKHFFPIMESMVMRYTQDEDQIIDILNNGFLRVFQKIEKFDNQGSFEGWIRKIIYHAISDYFRAGKKDLRFLIYQNEYTKEPQEEEQHTLYYQDLMSLVEKLPDIQMQVFHLHAIEGYNHKEISEKLKINHSTCRWYLTEARKFLQEEYSKLSQKDFNEAG